MRTIISGIVGIALGAGGMYAYQNGQFQEVQSGLQASVADLQAQLETATGEATTAKESAAAAAEKIAEMDAVQSAREAAEQLAAKVQEELASVTTNLETAQQRVSEQGGLIEQLREQILALQTASQETNEATEN